MSRHFLVIGAISGFLSVALGAFAAHALKVRLTAHLLAIFETGVRYQLTHALALLAVGILARGSDSRLLQVAGWSFVGGTLVFSGSLYALSTLGERWLGAITPVGGAAFLVGWACLAAAAWRQG
ncbi:MAG: membrane protein [Myxococcales bacterium]